MRRNITPPHIGFGFIVIVISVFFVVLALVNAGKDTRHDIRVENAPYIPTQTAIPLPYMQTSIALSHMGDATNAATIRNLQTQTAKSP